MTAKQFFDDVLPSTGKYIVAVEAHEPRVMFSGDEILQIAAMYPANNIYFSPASFDEVARRADECVLARRALVLDIDIRTDKPGCYVEYESPMAEIERLVAEGILPPYSWMVNSGMGLHVYWVCERDMLVPEWRRVNLGFMQQVDDFADKRILQDAPTAKRASGYFRVPTSINVKHGTPLSCDILRGLGSRTPEDWRIYFQTRPVTTVQGTSGKSAPQLPQIPDAPAWVAATPNTRTHSPSLGDMYEPTRTDYGKLVAGCAVFARAIQDPQSLTYHGWMDVARTLVTAEDGYARFHEISKLDPKQYDPAHTDKKWEDAKDMSKGVRCSRLRETMCGGDVSLCQGCPQFKDGGAAGSPINLAKIVPEDFDHAPVTPESTQELRSVGEGDALLLVTEPNEAEVPPYLKQGGNEEYEIRGDKLWVAGQRDPDEPGEWLVKPGVVSDVPFWVIRVWGKAEGETRQHINHTDEFGYVDEAGVVRTAEIETGTSVDINAFVRACAKQGLRLDASTKAKADKLRRYLPWATRMSNPAGAGRGESLERNGWVTEDHDTFLLGDLLMQGGKKAKRVRLDGHAKWLRKHWGVGTKGTFTDHLEMIRWYAKDGVDPVVRLTLLLGFASPLMKFAGLGSSCVMLRGRSGTGKTSMLKVLNGIWGRPISSTLNDKNSQVGNDGVLAALNNLPAVFDEITTKDDNEFRNMVLGVSTEQMIAKKHRDGSLRDTNEEWTLLMVMSSNKSIRHYIKGVTDADDAARRRVFEIEYPWESSIPSTPEWGVWTAALSQTLESHYGWLGQVFMNHVVGNVDKIKARIQELRIEARANKTSYAARYDENIQAVARMAGEIIEELGWMGTGSWCDDGFKASQLHKEENERRRASEIEISEEELSPELTLDRCISDYMSEYKHGFIIYTNGVQPMWESTQRQHYGIKISNAPNNENNAPPGTWVLVRKTHFDEYMERSRATDTDAIVPKWRGKGASIEVASYPVGALVEAFRDAPDPVYYHFKTG